MDKYMLKNVALLLLLVFEVCMGSWGVGVFENDAAIDLIDDILDAENSNDYIGEFVDYCTDNLHAGYGNDISDRFIEECIALCGFVAALGNKSINDQLKSSVPNEQQNELKNALDLLEYKNYLQQLQNILRRSEVYSNQSYNEIFKALDEMMIE